MDEKNSQTQKWRKKNRHKTDSHLHHIWKHIYISIQSIKSIGYMYLSLSLYIYLYICSRVFVSNIEPYRPNNVINYSLKSATHLEIATLSAGLRARWLYQLQRSKTLTLKNGVSRVCYKNSSSNKATVVDIGEK